MRQTLPPTVYLVTVKDRHTDDSVSAFSSAKKAVDRAEYVCRELYGPMAWRTNGGMHGGGIILYMASGGDDGPMVIVSRHSIDVLAVSQW